MEGVEKILLAIEGPNNQKTNYLQNNIMENFLNSKENEIKKITSNIEADLKTKNLKDLLWIFYNAEKYAYGFFESQRKENENLLVEVEDLVAKANSIQSNKQYIQSQVEMYKKQIEEKEQNLIQLMQEKALLDRTLDKNSIIKQLRLEIEEQYNKPKSKLINDFIDKKISYDEYIKEFKELGVKYHYYTILVDKLEKIR